MIKRILFADDEFAPDTETHLGSYMSYYEVSLREAGFDVTRATGPDESLAAMTKGGYDMAILDVMMPPGDAFRDVDSRKGVLTGIFLARRIHEMNPKLPILFLSNAGGNQSLFVESLKQEIVQRVLPKLDVTPFDLVKIVKEFSEGGDDA